MNWIDLAYAVLTAAAAIAGAFGGHSVGFSAGQQVQEAPKPKSKRAAKAVTPSA